MMATHTLKNPSWIFDLDNTLYRADGQFFSQIHDKMNAFICRYLNVDAEEATRLRREYWMEYGTTMSGLMAVHDMDPAEFLYDVHDVDLSFLTPEPALRTIIKSLSGPKYIFTNGSRGHAKNVGEHIELYDLFDGVFAIEDAGYIPKPQRSPYDEFCQRFSVDPQNAIMFEDSLKNLEVPKAMGMQTVLVRSGEDLSGGSSLNGQTWDEQDKWVDHVTDDLAGWLSEHFGEN